MPPVPVALATTIVAPYQPSYLRSCLRYLCYQQHNNVHHVANTQHITYKGIPNGWSTSLRCSCPPRPAVPRERLSALDIRILSLRDHVALSFRVGAMIATACIRRQRHACMHACMREQCAYKHATAAACDRRSACMRQRHVICSPPSFNGPAVPHCTA